MSSMITESTSRIRLESFDQRWAKTILDWITSSEELLNWSARVDFPLNDMTVFNEWHSDPEITPYVVLLDNELVAYGEVWLDGADDFAELGRMIVAPNYRRRGLGKLLIERLIAVVHGDDNRNIWLRVFSTNAPALRCYESAGFRQASAKESSSLNIGQRYSFIWMKRPI